MILGIFDSGLGGLTVLREIIRNDTYDKIIYFGDTLRLPYGDKDKETLLRYARENVDFLLTKGADEIIIACGTVSSNCLEELRDEYSLKITGIIDILCKEALSLTKNGKIGVIATPASVRSGIFSRKMKDAKVYEMPCARFTPLIEEGKKDSPEMDEAIREYLEPLRKEGIDTLIMGCTHYPLLTEKIERYFGYPIKIVNSGLIFARELSKGELRKADLEFYVSGDSEDFKKKARNFIDAEEIENVKKT